MLHNDVVRSDKYSTLTVWCIRLELESHGDGTCALAMLFELYPRVGRVLYVFVLPGNLLVMETYKFESGAEAALVALMIRKSEHYAMRQTKFVVHVQGCLQCREILRPLREVDKLLIVALATIFDQVSLFNPLFHFLPGASGDCPLLLLAKDRSGLILHNKVARGSLEQAFINFKNFIIVVEHTTFFPALVKWLLIHPS